MQPTAANHTPPKADAPVQSTLYVCIYEPCAHFKGKASTGEEAIFTDYDALLEWVKNPDDQIIVQIIGVSLATNQSADLTDKVCSDACYGRPLDEWPDWAFAFYGKDIPASAVRSDMADGYVDHHYRDLIS